MNIHSSRSVFFFHFSYYVDRCFRNVWKDKIINENNRHMPFLNSCKCINITHFASKIWGIVCFECFFRMGFAFTGIFDRLKLPKKRVISNAERNLTQITQCKVRPHQKLRDLSTRVLALLHDRIFLKVLIRNFL